MRNTVKLATLGAILAVSASRADAQLYQTRDVTFCGVATILNTCHAVHLAGTHTGTGTLVTLGLTNLQGSGFPGDGATWSSFRDFQFTDFTASGNPYTFNAGFNAGGTFGTGGGYGTESLVGGATGAFIPTNTSAFIQGSASSGKIQMKFSDGTVTASGSTTLYGIGGCASGSAVIGASTYTSDVFTCASSAPSAMALFSFFTDAPDVNLKDFDTFFSKSVGVAAIDGKYHEQSCYVGDEHEANLANAIEDGDEFEIGLYTDRLAHCTKLSDVTVDFAPEPASIALMATGLLGLVGVGMTRRNRLQG